MNISVGICASNERQNIGLLLEDLINQKLKPGYELTEIIVVSSGSTDLTNEIIYEINKKDKRIKPIIEKERYGKANAVNKILKMAEGDLLFLISADVHLIEGSIIKLAEVFSGNIGGADCGVGLLNSNESVVDFISNCLWEMRNVARKFELNDMAGDMFVIRTGIVDKIPEKIINDDAYLALMIRKKGWETVHVEDKLVYIMAPRTVKDYILQRERIIWGHKQLKESIGMEPSTLTFTIIKKPFKTLNMFVHEIRYIGMLNYYKVVIGVFLEIIANILTIIYNNNLTRYIKWKRIGSTKNLKIKKSK